jgi:hypothetical protein
VCVWLVAMPWQCIILQYIIPQHFAHLCDCVCCGYINRWCLPAAAAAAELVSPGPVSMASTKHEEALQQRCLLCFSTQPCQEGSADSCTSCIATLLP